MSISLGNALKFLKADEKWATKILLGGLISLVTIVLSYFLESKNTAVVIASLLLYFVFCSYSSGFLLSTANKILNNDERKFAEWSDKNIILKGLKFIFSYLVYSFIFGVIFTVVAVILTIIASIVLGIIYYLVNLALHLDYTVASYVLGFVFVVLFTIYILYAIQFLSAALTCYYKDPKFGNLMAFNKHFKIVLENQHASWSLVGKFILYALLFILITLVACITIIGVITIPFICFASYLVAVDLYAQYGTEIEVGKYL